MMVDEPKSYSTSKSRTMVCERSIVKGSWGVRERYFLTALDSNGTRVLTVMVLYVHLCGTFPEYISLKGDLKLMPAKFSATKFKRSHFTVARFWTTWARPIHAHGEHQTLGNDRTIWSSDPCSHPQYFCSVHVRHSFGGGTCLQTRCIWCYRTRHDHFMSTPTFLHRIHKYGYWISTNH